MRLGRLPDTAPWRRVVELVAEGADVPAVAAATTHAAANGLKAGKPDEGLRECLWVLLEATRAARADDFKSALLTAGVKVEGGADVLGVVSAVASALDAAARGRG